VRAGAGAAGGTWGQILLPMQLCRLCYRAVQSSDACRAVQSGDACRAVQSGDVFLLQDLAADGALRGCKLVAWPRDYRLLPRLGRRGFPHAGVLLQHNGAFGAVLEWLAHGSPALLTQVATQLTGAPPFPR
jgi:hypothetical protein